MRPTYVTELESSCEVLDNVLDNISRSPFFAGAL
jgi:hypothetical protein